MTDIFHNLASQELKEKQAYPLSEKIKYSKNVIQEWYDHWNGQVYLAFSGGKDSTVLKHIIESMKLDIPFVFVNTTNEWPEIVSFVNSFGKSITKLKPEKTFRKVVEEYGYPIVSKEQSQYIYEYRHTNSEYLKKLRKEGKTKTGRQSNNYKISNKWFFLTEAPFEISHKCCHYLKHRPMQQYVKETRRKAIVGTMAEESRLRYNTWIKYGCNSFDSKYPTSKPLSIWREEDIWEYIKKYKIAISDAYQYTNRTGCMGCAFGVHMEKGENRFQKMYHTHPKKWNFVINIMGYGKVLDYIGVPYK